jgi:multisubunit Na+/H+ antiporter MnhG subunit
MNIPYLVDMIIPKEPFPFQFFPDAPPRGDIRLLLFIFFLFIFLGLIGVLQIAASYNRMTALSFFRNPKVGYVFGVCSIVCGLLIFYLTGDRNVIAPRLEGPHVLGLTFLGIFTSVMATLVIAYFIKRKRVENVVRDDYPDGMEALQQNLYVPLMKRLWRRLKRRGQ